MPGGSDLEAKVSRQVEAAVRDADVVLFVVDAAVGVTDDDEAIADWLRRGRPRRRSSSPTRPTTTGARTSAGSSWRSGSASRTRSARCTAAAPATCSTSSSTGSPAPRGADDDLDARRQRARRASASRGRRTSRAPPRVAIVGRPNVGKSTLFNRLVGEDRSVVHDLAGTTRDAIDTLVETEDGPIVFVDTAGMRRRSRIDDSAEYYSLVRALRAIDDADIALLVIDATEGVTGQDQRLAERVDAAGCPIVVAAQQVGADRRPRRPRSPCSAELVAQAGLHRRRAGAQDLGAHRQGRAQAAPGAAGGDRAVPPAGADARRQPGARRGPAAPAGRRRRQGAVRRAGRHRPADVHAVRQPRAAAARTCATSSARSARRSTSARRRSSCGCGSGTADAMPWCEDCAKYWAPSAMTPDGACPTCGADLEAPERVGDAAATPTRRRRGTSSCWSSRSSSTSCYRFFEMFLA